VVRYPTRGEVPFSGQWAEGVNFWIQVAPQGDCKEIVRRFAQGKNIPTVNVWIHFEVNSTEQPIPFSM